MPLTEVQQVNAVIDNTTDLTINFAQTEHNNLCVVAIVSDALIHSGTGAPTGWTRVNNYQGGQAEVAIFWRLAPTGTHTSVTFTVGSGDKVAVFWEFSRVDSTDPFDTSAVGGSTSSSTGTTGTTEQDDSLALACIGASGSPGGDHWSALTNSFIEEADIGSGAGDGTEVNGVFASRALTATGAYGTSATYSGAGSDLSGGVVAIFKAAPIQFARVQAAASPTGPDPAQASFAVSPTEGNLMIVTALERSGGSAANFTISDNGSNTGWTKRVSETTEQADTNARRTHVVWERVATSTDAAQSNFTVTVDDGTSSGKRCQVEEFEAGTPVTWTFVTAVAANTGTGSTPPLASGSTSSTSGDQLLFGSAVWRQESASPTSIAFNNLTDLQFTSVTGNGMAIATAFAQSAATGAKSTEVDWDGTGHEGNIALLVFTATTSSDVTGSLSETQDSQTLSATGEVPYVGAVVETQADQTLVATGTVTGTGTLAEVQDDQTLAASGTLGLSGTLAATQADQTLSASGAHTGAGGSVGSLSEAQDNQTLSATGSVEYLGTLSTTQDDQVLVASGLVPQFGSIGVQADDQVLVAVGRSGIPIQPVDVRPRRGRLDSRVFPVRWRDG